MEITFLGTGAGMPSKQRNVSAIVLNLGDQSGRFWMFDCGEGTQHQLLHSAYKLGRLDHIWITHLHGDHLYGLPGLLTSRSFQGEPPLLTIWGPKGLSTYLETVLQISAARLTYPYIINEIDQGLLFEDEDYTVEAALLDHRIECYGYRITEKPKPGSLDHEKLRSLGLRPGPLYGQLKSGMDVQLPDGTHIYSADVVGPPIKGRVVAIIGDTRPTANAIKLAKDADLVVHEATFSADMADKSAQFGHSTSVEAAEIALAAAAKVLILTHFSSRFQSGEEELLAEEARTVFPHVLAASDLWSYSVARP